MELGGKSASIVCEDADIEAAAQSAAVSTVFNKGEVCTAGSRVFVHESVEDAFLEAFARRLAAVRQGDPLDPMTQLGAQAYQIQIEKIKGYLELAPRGGATVRTGGKPGRIEGPEEGYFIEQTIFTDVRNEMQIAQEENIGPVQSLLR